MTTIEKADASEVHARMATSNHLRVPIVNRRKAGMVAAEGLPWDRNAGGVPHGIFNTLPILMKSELMPLAAMILLAVVPKRRAMAPTVSPALTV